MSKSVHGKWSLSLRSDVMKVVDEFAALSGLSRSAVVSGLLEQAVPTLKLAASTMRELTELDAQQRKEISEELAMAEKRALEQQKEIGANAETLLHLIHASKFAKI